MLVRDVMTPDLLTIVSTAPIKKALRVIKEHNLQRLPVVEDGNLVGLVTRHLVTVSSTDSVEEATSKAKAAGVGTVIVLDNNKVVGTWTLKK